MNSLPKRLLSVLIAVPITIVFFLFLDTLGPVLTEESGAVDLSSEIFESTMLLVMFATLVFVLIGIPVSYGVDYVAKKMHNHSHVQSYLVKLVLYTMIAVFMIMLTFERGSALDLVPISGIIGPVLIGYHVLFLIRKEYRAKQPAIKKAMS
ncbi:hypothetical protein [Planococcus sp. ISL-109]|uniref:hypothetical protein n=1 Tax=Planococcus sp. ISL-109 TaxID=2819166 RepID=UPI001BEB4672|nr:hypothetical protein [Planococcus sp. ISL-109]MBT2581251.1 hypothetical protein [Planococcus sp. ISL-109]